MVIVLDQVMSFRTNLPINRIAFFPKELHHRFKQKYLHLNSKFLLLKQHKLNFFFFFLLFFFSSSFYFFFLFSSSLLLIILIILVWIEYYL